MNNPLPQQMYRNGRAPDPDFTQEERLYIRFERLTGGKIEVTDIICPNQSVNRSKYSEPEWVLLTECMSFANWGYGYFEVGEILDHLISPGGIYFYFRIVHDPLDTNYSHSEIRAYRDQHRQQRARNINNRTTNLEFRIHIRNITKILEIGSDTIVED